MTCSRFHFTQTTLGACPTINFDEAILEKGAKGQQFLDLVKYFNPNQAEAASVFFELLNNGSATLSYFLKNWNRTRTFINNRTFYPFLAILDHQKIAQLRDFLLAEPDFEKQRLWAEIMKYRETPEETWAFWKKIYNLDNPEQALSPTFLANVAETFLNEKTPVRLKQEIITLLLNNKHEIELFALPGAREEIALRRWSLPKELLFKRLPEFSEDEIYTLLADLTGDEIKAYFAQRGLSTFEKGKIDFFLAGKDENLVAANWSSIVQQLPYINVPSLWQTTADFLAQHGQEIVPASQPPQTYLEQIQAVYQKQESLTIQLKMTPVLLKILPVHLLTEADLQNWHVSRHEQSSGRKYQEPSVLYYSLLSRQKELAGDLTAAAYWQNKALTNFSCLQHNYAYYQVLSPLQQQVMQTATLKILQEIKPDQIMPRQINEIGLAFFYASLDSKQAAPLGKCFSKFFDSSRQQIASDLKNSLLKNLPFAERIGFAQRLLSLAVNNPPPLRKTKHHQLWGVN